MCGSDRLWSLNIMLESETGVEMPMLASVVASGNTSVCPCVCGK